jgi:hypothetical protein
MNYKKLSIIAIFLFANLNLFSQSFDNPIVMYVNATSGLRVRNEPSINSNIRGTLLYGQRIVIYGKSETTVTIDGITDYWYEISHKNGWVFGGYLSINFPLNVPFILGLWEEGDIIFNFNTDYTYSVGAKEANWFDNGKWELNRNTLTIIQTDDGWEDIINPIAVKIVITVINEKNILLNYKGKQYNLKRSNYPYTFY